MNWDGMKRGTEEEFDTKEVKKILSCYMYFKKRFYLMEMYDPKNKYFLFVVFMAESPDDDDDDDAKDYTAKLIIPKSNSPTTY